MATLNKFTIRSLKLNKKRTLVTAIGIVLSVALICAVAGVFMSFRETLIQNTINNYGKYHSMFKDAPKNSIDIVENNKKVESYYYTHNIGYTEFDSKNENLPYLYIMAFNDLALENAGLKLESGRLPQNENEIVITKNVNINSNTEYKIGKVLELDIFESERHITFDELGNIEDIYDETTPLFTRESTIVGIAENISNHYITAWHELRNNSYYLYC